MIRNFLAIVMAVFALQAFAAADVNRASQAELETIKGIGPGLSAKILQARQTSAFKNWDDLVDRVGGIGPGNAARFSQAGLTVGGSSFEGKAADATQPKGKASAKAPKTPKSETSKSEAGSTTDTPARKARETRETREARKPMN